MFRLSAIVAHAGVVVAALSLPAAPTLANDDDTMLAIDALVANGFQAKCALHYGVGSKRATETWVQNMRVFDREFLRVYGATLLDISKNVMHVEPHTYIEAAAKVMENKSQPDIDLMCSKSAQGQREVLTKLKLKGNHERILLPKDRSPAVQPIQPPTAQAEISHPVQSGPARETGQKVVACDGRTVTFEQFVGATHTKTWTDELLTFYFEKMIVLHGTEADGSRITRVTENVISWHDDDQYKTTGTFNRVGMNGREELKGLGAEKIVNYYDTCRIAKPRI
jgi:hypothetical protein